MNNTAAIVLSTAILSTVLVLCACAPGGSSQGWSSPTGVANTAFNLAEPNVTMEADPPPPFTYWATEGSTIRNHPRQSGVWIAAKVGEPDRYYFGDQCKASELQRFVGRPVEALPDTTPSQQLRFACTECAVTSDLRWDRLNVWFDEETKIIAEVSCG